MKTLITIDNLNSVSVQNSKSSVIILMILFPPFDHAHNPSKFTSDGFVPFQNKLYSVSHIVTELHFSETPHLYRLPPQPRTDGDVRVPSTTQICIIMILGIIECTFIFGL